MMGTIVDIEPNELKFVVELRKQSLCSIRLTNKTAHHVAFKVKTTSPKRYCVRPNVGVVLPESTCEFSVTMQALKTGLTDVDCKDKFLIQSTVVLPGTTDADITSAMFAKDDGKYIQERKLRVILIPSSESPMLSPIKGDLKQGQGHEPSVQKDQVFGGVEILPQQKMVTKDVKSRAFENEESKPLWDTELKPSKEVELKQTKEELKPAEILNLKLAKDEELNPVKDLESKQINDMKMEQAKDVELKPAIVSELKPTEELELTPAKDVELTPAKEVELKPAKDMELKPAEDVELKPAEAVELKPLKVLELNGSKFVEDLKLVNDIEGMKSKLNELELKLSQAEVTILKLTEERSLSIQERRNLQEQLGQLSTQGVKRVQVGFPLLFVCMVALVSVVLGYRLRC